MTFDSNLSKFSHSGLIAKFRKVFEAQRIWSKDVAAKICSMKENECKRWNFHNLLPLASYLLNTIYDDHEYGC